MVSEIKSAVHKEESVRERRDLKRAIDRDHASFPAKTIEIERREGGATAEEEDAFAAPREIRNDFPGGFIGIDLPIVHRAFFYYSTFAIADEALDAWISGLNHSIRQRNDGAGAERERPDPGPSDHRFRS